MTYQWEKDRIAVFLGCRIKDFTAPLRSAAARFILKGDRLAENVPKFNQSTFLPRNQSKKIIIKAKKW